MNQPTILRVRRQNWARVLPLGRSPDFQSSFPGSCILIRSLRSAGIETRAIALTAYARHEEADEAHGAGFQMHLRKPIDAGPLSTPWRETPSTPEGSLIPVHTTG